MKYTYFLLLLLLFACSSKSAEEENVVAKNATINNNKEVVCFVYHRFGDDRYPSTNIGLSTFEQHLQFLKENNYQVLSFADAIDYLKDKSPKVKTAVITIDDGYTSFYDNGLPLLKKYGFPATLFINTKTVGGGSYMDWKQIKTAHNAGVEIGNHTHSHPYFLNLDESERYSTFRNEINKAQDLIEKHIGEKPETFAYPYGEMDNKMIEIIKGMGFKAAAAQNSGVIYSGTNIFRCPRFPMAEAFAEIEKFESKAEMHALQLIDETPTSFLSEQPDPELTLTFEKDSLEIEQLQCFVQGSSCKMDIKTKADTVVVHIQSKTAIDNRRRTLYTITAPDQNGQWHWFSHLWIYPEVR